jgi:hypothetical protein
VLVEELRSLDERVAVLDREIARHAKENSVADQLDTGMALTGVTDVASVPPEVIVKPDALR